MGGMVMLTHDQKKDILISSHDKHLYIPPIADVHLAAVHS